LEQHLAHKNHKAYFLSPPLLFLCHNWHPLGLKEMVKTGSERSAKFSAKHDAKVIIMRIKAAQNAMKNLFQKAAYDFEVSDISLQMLMEQLDLGFGQFGELSDILKGFLWKYDDLSVTDLEALHQKLLAKGYTEDDWSVISDWLETTAHLIKSRYEVCHFPPTRLFSLVQVQLDKDTD
jgi:hypothetical protein